MSDQFTALAVTKAVLNIFRWRLLSKSDLSIASASERGIRLGSLCSDRSEGSSMPTSTCPQGARNASQILPEGGKSVHFGGTFGLEYCRYGKWLTFAVIAFKIGASVELAELPSFLPI